MEFLMAAFPVICEKAFDYTIGPVGRQIGYPIDYKKNVDNLTTQVKELEDARDSVQRRVEDATRNVEQIEGRVQRWLTDVEEIMAKVGKFFEDEGQAKMKCCNGQCPNLKTRYQLSKRAYKLGLNVTEIKDKGMFPIIGYRAPIQGIGTTISTKGYENFESRIAIFDEVMKALNDDNIRAIGVCGMGGTGKTMLVAKVATQSMEEKLFEKVVKIVVSQTPKFKKIQEYIAKELSLHFQKKDVDSRRAELLRERLKQENKILIIIDDIWKKLDLEALGISFEDDNKGCKILLTSRSRDVLGRDMGAQKIFHVGVLLNNEPTYLFKKIVGNIVETSDFQSIAVEVIEECGGLPIAITAVAHALKGETDPKVWKDALRQLKTANPIDIEGMHEMVYPSIRLSYDVLSKEAKSLFLFCSTADEDFDIPIELLGRLLVGLDFLEDVFTIEEVRNKVYTLVKKLKASSLLLEGEESGTLKMHDVIRDVAIYIADKGKEMLTIRGSDDLKKWLNSKVLEDSIIMTLEDIDFSEFPGRLECPKVQFIALETRKGALQIPNTFFEGVKNLKVLLLNEICLTKLPSSLLFLDNLQTLYLTDCKLEDITMIGELRNLKILALSQSNIRQLPKEIEQLTQLKLLDLEDCSELEVIPPNVLSNLKKLEELYMKRSFNKWEIEEPTMERSNAKISDLDHLSNLTTLQIEIPNAKILPKVLFLEKLERYEILIGNNWDWDWDSYSEHEPEISRKLKLCLDRSFQVEADIKKLLKSCECLYLGKMEGVNRIIYKDLPKLKYLNMTGNAGIQYITSWMGVQRVAFPLLESISLKDLINLEKICHSQLAVGSFSNLRKIEVCDCNSLRFMFSSSVVGYFSKLQEIDIRRCTGMRAIVAKEGEEEIEINDITANIMEFPQLRCFHIEDLPNLMGFYSGVDSHLLFNEKVGFPKLEEIHIRSIDNLMMIWHNQLVPYSFCKLQKLIVDNCGNLKKVFPHNILRIIQNLEKLEILNCASVEEVFEIRSVNVEHVWSSDPQANLTIQNLRDVYIADCKSLKSIFPISVAKSLAQLEKLWIKDCGVEEIVAMEEESEISTEFVLPKMAQLILQGLPELKCFCPRKQTSKWPSLKTLNIYGCPKVEIVSSDDLSSQDTNGMGHHHVPIQRSLFLIDKVGFPKLEEIRIDGMDNLLTIWHNQLIPHSFCKLQSLIVKNCGNLKKIFPHNMLRIIQNLEKLEIWNCASVKEVFEIRSVNVEETIDTVASTLRDMKLCNLPTLKQVWSSDPQANLTFQNLGDVYIADCISLKSIFPISVAKSLAQLEKLWIKDCGVEEIVALEKGSEISTEFVLPEMAELILQGLPKLKCFCPRKHTSKWPSLKTLKIYGCPKVEIVCSDDSSCQDTIGLGHHHVPIRRPLFLIDKDTFPNLQSLEVCECHGLSCLVTSSSVKSLVRLCRMVITKCETLTKLVTQEGRDEAGDEIYFGELENLELHYLPSLKGFNLSNRTIRFPLLKEVIVIGCPELKIFSNGILSSPELKRVELSKSYEIDYCGQRIIGKYFWDGDLNTTVKRFWEDNFATICIQQLFTEKDTFPNLEELMVDCDCAEPLAKFFRKQQVCELYKYRGFSPALAQGMCNLKNLHVRHSFVHEICPYEIIDEEGHLEGLRWLDLSEMDYLLHLWNENFQPGRTFQNLESLEVSNCGRLKNLVPSSISFQNLHYLKVRECHGLSCLVTSSTAKSLVRLRKMVIIECKTLKKIVTDDGGDEVGDEICFSQLVDLKLVFLPSLKGFSLSNCTIRFPLLKCVRVGECPELKMFSNGVLSTPELETVGMATNIEWGPRGYKPINPKMLWEGGLNTTVKRFWEDNFATICIQQLFTEKDAFPNLEELMMDCDCAEPLAKFFRKQDICELYKYRGFSTALAQGLCNLKNLQVRHSFVQEICPYEIFDTEGPHEGLRWLDLSEMDYLLHLWNENSQPGSTFRNLEILDVSKCGRLKNFVPSSISFQNLYFLKVSECHGLSCLVTSSTAKSLVQLRTLVITDCKTMKKIVTDDGGDEICFSQLEGLYIHCLPSLKGFNLSNRSMRFPVLKYVCVSGCPELKMFSNGDLSTPELKTVEMAAYSEWDRRGYFKPLNGKELWEGGLNTTINRFWEDNFATICIQQLFTEKDTFPNLEELMMDCDCAEPLVEFFRKQHVCELFKYRGFSSALAQGLCNLKNLHVFRHSFVGEICPYELFDKEGYLEGLRELDLFEMDYLLHLWNENSQPGSTFQNLVSLKVSKCGRLKNLVPSSISFQNLESLEVCECHGLSCLVTPSVAKSLVQLRTLKITECNKMTEIVRDEGGDEAGDEISFTRLEFLTLQCLPSLKGFNLSNRSIRFPLLEFITVTGCPELKIFSNGVLSTGELNVELAKNYEKNRWPLWHPQVGDLNTTITRFWEDNFDTCIQQLFTEKANESTGEDE